MCIPLFEKNEQQGRYIGNIVKNICRARIQMAKNKSDALQNWGVGGLYTVTEV